MARAYKVHVAVFFNDSYWMTTAVTDLNKCKIFLLYRGSLVFEDSRWVTVAEYTERRWLYSQLDRYYKKLEQELKKKANRPVIKSRNAIPSDSETSENIMPSNNDGSSDSSSSEEDMDQETTSGKEQSADDISKSENDIMPAKSSLKEQSSEEASETDKNIMPQQESLNGNHSSPAKDDVDMNLEKIMEESTYAAKGSHSSSSFSHSSSGSSSSDEETLSEESAFICSTATCGEVFDSAAGLRAHERKHSGRRSKYGRIHCDYPRCIKHYGTKCALQCHKKNTHDNPGKLLLC